MGVIYGYNDERPRLKMLSFSTLSALTPSLSPCSADFNDGIAVAVTVLVAP